MTVHRSTTTLLITVALGLAAATGVAVAAADDAENEFLETIQQEGMVITSPQSAVEDAGRVCAALAEGRTGVEIGNQIIRDAGVTGHQATVFVVEATHAFCPDLMKQVLAENG